jgi:hypothetical protein
MREAKHILLNPMERISGQTSNERVRKVIKITKKLLVLHAQVPFYDHENF